MKYRHSSSGASLGLTCRGPRGSDGGGGGLGLGLGSGASSGAGGRVWSGPSCAGL